MYGVLLLDCPADHEIDRRLTTECDTIAAILHGRKLQSKLKHVRLSTPESLDEAKKNVHRYRVNYVHVAGHGSRDGIALVGGNVEWSDLAQTLTSKWVAPLRKSEQRVLCVSCCFSPNAVAAMKPSLSRYFTGCYYFRDCRVPFATAITVWSMFYLKKTLALPHQKIVQSINEFLDEEALGFVEIANPKPKASPRKRFARRTVN